MPVISEGKVVISQTQSLVQREFTAYNEGKGFHKEAFKLWNYGKNNSCHPVIIEWFSVQIIFVNDEIFKLSFNSIFNI